LWINWMNRNCHSVIFNKTGPRIAYLTGLRNKSKVYLEIILSGKAAPLSRLHSASVCWKTGRLKTNRPLLTSSKETLLKKCCNSARYDDCNVRKHGALCQTVFPRRRKSISSSSVTRLSPPHLPGMHSQSFSFVSILLYHF
jgi:hypothetical protein